MFLSGALENKQETIEMATWHERLQEHLFEVQLQAQLEKTKNVLELLRNDGLFVKRRGENIDGTAQGANPRNEAEFDSGSCNRRKH